MASDVRIRFRSFLPGAGFDSSGNPKQGKTRVVGVVSVTSYGGSSGEPLAAEDVGLNNIDFIQLRVSDENSGDMSSAGFAPIRKVTYTKSTGHFYLYNEIEADIAEVASGSTETVEFVAEGDSAHDVELL